jgi:hypothetical protein
MRPAAARFRRPALVIGVLVVCAGCTTLPARYQSLRTTDIADDTPVRFYPPSPSRQPPIRGRALDWTSGMPRLITRDADTLMVPRDAKRQILIPERRSRVVAGGVIGWAVGAITSYANCPSPKRYCGEQDPTPLLATVLGAFIGSRMKTDWWVTVP